MHYMSRKAEDYWECGASARDKVLQLGNITLSVSKAKPVARTDDTFWTDAVHRSRECRTRIPLALRRHSVNKCSHQSTLVYRTTSFSSRVCAFILRRWLFWPHNLIGTPSSWVVHNSTFRSCRFGRFCIRSNVWSSLWTSCDVKPRTGHIWKFVLGATRSAYCWSFFIVKHIEVHRYIWSVSPWQRKVEADPSERRSRVPRTLRVAHEGSRTWSDLQVDWIEIFWA